MAKKKVVGKSLESKSAAAGNRVFYSKWLDLAETRTLKARDGVLISYQTLGNGDETLVLANGLGGRLYAWEPILDAFGDKYRIITWDYRGLFESGAPEKIRRLSIPDHAEDVKEILDAEGI